MALRPAHAAGCMLTVHGASARSTSADEQLPQVIRAFRQGKLDWHDLVKMPAEPSSGGEVAAAYYWDQLVSAERTLTKYLTQTASHWGNDHGPLSAYHVRTLAQAARRGGVVPPAAPPRLLPRPPPISGLSGALERMLMTAVLCRHVTLCSTAAMRSTAARASAAACAAGAARPIYAWMRATKRCLFRECAAAFAPGPRYTIPAHTLCRADRRLCGDARGGRGPRRLVRRRWQCGHGEHGRRHH